MTSAGTESTTISLPDATTEIGLLDGRAAPTAPPAPSWASESSPRTSGRPTTCGLQREGKRAPPHLRKWRRPPSKGPEPGSLPRAGGRDHVGRERGGPAGLRGGGGKGRQRCRLAARGPRTHPSSRASRGREQSKRGSRVRGRALPADRLGEPERPGHVPTGTPRVARRGRECPLPSTTPSPPPPPAHRVCIFTVI